MLSALCTQGSLELTGCIFVSLFLLTQHGTVYWIQTLIMWTRKAISTVRILLIYCHCYKSLEWMELDYCWYCCCMEDSLLVSNFQKRLQSPILHIYSSDDFLISDEEMFYVLLNNESFEPETTSEGLTHSLNQRIIWDLPNSESTLLWFVNSIMNEILRTGIQDRTSVFFNIFLTYENVIIWLK